MKLRSVDDSQCSLPSITWVEGQPDCSDPRGSDGRKWRSLNKLLTNDFQKNAECWTLFNLFCYMHVLYVWRTVLLEQFLLILRELDQHREVFQIYWLSWLVNKFDARDFGCVLPADVEIETLNVRVLLADMVCRLKLQTSLAGRHADWNFRRVSLTELTIETSTVSNQTRYQ